MNFPHEFFQAVVFQGAVKKLAGKVREENILGTRMFRSVYVSRHVRCWSHILSCPIFAAFSFIPLSVISKSAVCPREDASWRENTLFFFGITISRFFLLVFETTESE